MYRFRLSGQVYGSKAGRPPAELFAGAGRGSIVPAPVEEPATVLRNRKQSEVDEGDSGIQLRDPRQSGR